MGKLTKGIKSKKTGRGEQSFPSNPRFCFGSDRGLPSRDVSSGKLSYICTTRFPVTRPTGHPKLPSDDPPVERGTIASEIPRESAEKVRKSFRCPKGGAIGNLSHIRRDYLRLRHHLELWISVIKPRMGNIPETGEFFRRRKIREDFPRKEKSKILV